MTGGPVRAIIGSGCMKCPRKELSAASNIFGTRVSGSSLRQFAMHSSLALVDLAKEIIRRRWKGSGEEPDEENNYRWFIFARTNPILIAGSRLIAAFDFRRQIAFVKFVGTHDEYDARRFHRR